MPFSLAPSYINSSGRRIFTLYFPAASAGKSSVLLIPPFADEMNKSRRMYSELARSLSQAGHNALIFDFYGTGDSEGLLQDATWDCWLADIRSCLSLLNDKGADQIALMAIRSGALLATDCLKSANSSVSRVLFWQPVIDGKMFLNQFMRLRLASSMMSTSKNKEIRKDLKAGLDCGERLEIAGYTITGSLAKSLEAASLRDFLPEIGVDIAWYDVVSNKSKESPLVNRKLVEQWQQAGVSIEHRKVVGMPFWNSTEIVEIPELIDTSLHFFNRAMLE